MSKTTLIKIGFSLIILSSLNIGKTFTVSNVTEFRNALDEAAFNGEDDTIYLQPGTYKTSSDGGGTFRYSDDEAYSLTIIGSEKGKTILDGDNTNRVFSYNNEQGTQLILKNLIIQNGKKEGILENGGGIFININKKAEINHCVFKKNYSSGSAGALDIDHAKLVIVKNSSFIENKTEQFGAAIFGGNFSKLIVYNTTFKNNSSVHGAAIANNGRSIIVHSSFYNNGYNINNANPILGLVDNASGNTVKIENGLIINNIFAQNKYDLWIDEPILSKNYKVKLYNNYINQSKIKVADHAILVKKNTINSVSNGDIKFINNNLQIASDSPARNKGMNIYSNEFKQVILGKTDISPNNLTKDEKNLLNILKELQYDKNGNARDESPDLGAYEYDKNAKVEPLDNNLETNSALSSSNSSFNSSSSGGGANGYLFPLLSILILALRKTKKFLS